MDYEKAYSEALERARQFSEHPLQEDSANIVEYIFPELKESEDEKIIKWLIEDIKDTLSSNNMPNDYKDMAEKAIAWLKKQGKNGDMKEMQGEQQSSASTLTQEEVQKLHDHLEMHKQLPKSVPQTITFTDSGTMQVIDKLNEIIGKLGDIHEVLSKPSIYPYEPIITTRPYTGGDYLMFLKRIGYAKDRDYARKVAEIVRTSK